MPVDAPLSCVAFSPSRLQTPLTGRVVNARLYANSPACRLPRSLPAVWLFGPLVATSNIVRKCAAWVMPSQSGKGRYTVQNHLPRLICYLIQKSHELGIDTHFGAETSP